LSLAQISNLKAYYSSSKGYVKAVDGVSLTINYEEILGLAGESGCGKSTFVNALMMNIQPPLHLIDGEIFLDGQKISDMNRKILRTRVWGQLVSLVPQSALNALMPTMRIIDFIKDVMRAHSKKISDSEIFELATKHFQELNLQVNTLKMYPHELSGGMRQRVAIAIATLLNPKLLISDEPTSALDVSTQKRVIKMMLDLRKRGFIKSMLFVTHDIAILRQIADRIAIMYAGKIVEVSPIIHILKKPLHPYTEGLINAVITPEPEIRKRGISYVKGSPPNLLDPPSGCRFHPRCPHAMDICRTKEPPLQKIEKDILVACHLYGR